MLTLTAALGTQVAAAGISGDKSSLKKTSVSNSTEEKKSEEPEEEQPKATVSSAATSTYHSQAPDSTDLNSVCKFNFIFYFIYKMKYDEAPSGGSQLNFEF